MSVVIPKRPSENAYLDFVRREYPSEEKFIKELYADVERHSRYLWDPLLMPENDMGNTSNSIFLVEFGSEPRRIHFISEATDLSSRERKQNSIWVAKLEKMAKFMVNSPPHERQIVISWEYGAWDNNKDVELSVAKVVIAAFAQTTFIHPKRISALIDWTTRQYPAGPLVRRPDVKHNQMHRAWKLYDNDRYLATLDRVYMTEHYDATKRTLFDNVDVKTMSLPCIGVGVFGLAYKPAFRLTDSPSICESQITVHIIVY